MKKRILLSLLAVAAIATTVTMLISQKSSMNKSEQQALARTDRMDLAMEQEFMLTRDQKLNRIPKERLLIAEDYRKRKLKNKSDLGQFTAVSGINWSERGPSNVGGRTRAVWFDLNDAPLYRKVWAAGVSGGLWSTPDITVASPVWTRYDDFLENLAISSFAQDAANPQTMYFGTGEGWFNVDAVRGLGIWKSTNGGTSWAQLSSTNNSSFYYVQKILITTGGTLLACTGTAGLQRSTDGGNTWTKVLGLGANGGVNNAAADLEVAPNGDLYCSLGIFSAGKIYRSTDNGVTWTDISPAGSARRIELATAPSSSDTVYALFHSSTNNNCDAIQRYRVSTGTWTACTVPTIIDQGSNSNFTRGQAWYDLIAAVDPNNHASLYIGGVDALRSDDAGATWTQMTTWSLFAAPAFTAAQNVHADHHMITYVPGSSSRALWGTDGGVYYTTDANVTGAGVKPTFIAKNDGFNVTQYYAGAMHPTLTNYFLAGAQDNGSHKFTGAGINAVTSASGGDGAFCHIDQDNGNIQITSYVYNNYYVSTNGGTSFPQRSKNNRGSFINPTDYDDANNILYGADNAGSYFRWLSPETNGVDNQVTCAQFSASKVSHVAVSPITSNRVFFGMENGSVVMVDNANTGTSVTGTVIKPAVAGSVVSCVAVDPANENHLLVTVSNYGVAHVYESIDALGGSPTWTVVDGNLPDMPVRWAMFDPRNADWAILATELGVWSTDNLNGGATDWDPTNNGLANVRVDMLQYRSADRTIMASTHGRGVFTAVVPAVTTPDINFATATLSASEQTAASNSCLNYRDYNVTLTIANAPVGDATVTINVNPGNTATIGQDIDFTTNGNFATPANTVVFANGATSSKTISVRIYDDAQVEAVENLTFSYSISGTTNAQPGSGAQSHAISITDNDVAPTGSTTALYTIGTASTYLGNPTTGTGSGQPFDAKLQVKKTMFQYRASELIAAGMTAGNITALQFNFGIKNSTRPYENVQIKMGTSSIPNLVDGSYFPQPVSVVKTIASFTPSVGWNNFLLDVPFAWNGTSNVVIEICYDNATADAANFADMVIGYSDGGSSTQGNIFWKDNIGCATAFSGSASVYFNGLKPQLRANLTTTGTPIATALNASRSEYLGPNADAYFYSTGGELLARVRNLSNHDYGCTQVVIDRAGTTSAQFWNNNTANYLMNKTFRIIPTNNNPAGNYEVTLYYSPAEVTGWQTATGQTFNNIQLIKVAGQILSVTPASPNAAGAVQSVVPTRGTLGPNYTLTYTFNNGFSGFGAGITGNALPVTLLDFSGKLKNNSAALDWRTASEQNSRSFEIERSYDGSNFKKVGVVQAAGSSSSIRSYTFTDKDIAQDVNYYRLKQIDLDNRSEYSKVVVIRNPGSNKYAFRILSNPVADNLDIQFGTAPTGNISIRLFDISGKQVLNWQSQSGGQQRIRIDLSRLNLAKGTYVVKAKTATQEFTERIVKQ